MTKNVQVKWAKIPEIFRPVKSMKHCILNLDFVCFFFISSVLIQIMLCSRGAKLKKVRY